MKIGASTARTPDRVSLWLLTIGPTSWAAHLLVCYATVSIWCSKFTAPGGSLGGAGTAIAWYTGIALAGIAVVGWEGFRRHSYGGAEATTHDLDSPEDRHRFLGFATLLLSGLSAVAVLLAAFAAAHFDTCR